MTRKLPDALRSCIDELMRHVRQRPRSGELLSDDGNVRILRRPFGLAEAVKSLTRQLEDRVCPCAIALLSELDLHVPNLIRHDCLLRTPSGRRHRLTGVPFTEGAKALVETERRVDGLTDEVDGLRHSRQKVFRAPPIEWIKERVMKLQAVLEQRTARSAQALRNVLGPIRLEGSRPTSGDPSTGRVRASTRSR